MREQFAIAELAIEREPADVFKHDAAGHAKGRSDLLEREKLENGMTGRTGKLDRRRGGSQIRHGTGAQTIAAELGIDATAQFAIINEQCRGGGFKLLGLRRLALNRACLGRSDFRTHTSASLSASAYARSIARVGMLAG